ncbi:MAG: choloylglycine hydrolase family protein [Ruminococcaceae bacterium]|nr:choloylglycine hydrolase family protein [Oscillospiraceae bacterium]
MCTAAAYRTNTLYFGRTLDNDITYGEKITVTPRNYPLSFRYEGRIDSHFAVIGMAHISKGYPLYYDAMNEKGLCIAGLNFTGNAVYRKPVHEKNNIAQFELIPWILGKCKSVEDAVKLLKNTNITDDSFSENLPVSQLHWIIADRKQTVTVEAVSDGLRIYENPAHVLTNNPPFDKQLFSLNNYMHLSPREPQNKFSDNLNLEKYSRGMGAMGMPGDLSSQSRFIRSAFANLNSVKYKTEDESVNQFFHTMNTVEQTKGCCILDNGKYEFTVYTSCCCADSGIYYYTTYGNRQISAVSLFKENIDGKNLIGYTLNTIQNIYLHN